MPEVGELLQQDNVNVAETCAQVLKIHYFYTSLYKQFDKYDSEVQQANVRSSHEIYIAEV